jgi:hypothetical protein
MILKTLRGPGAYSAVAQRPVGRLATGNQCGRVDFEPVWRGS